MFGVTIILLLACSSILVQGYRGSNINSNQNSNFYHARRGQTPLIEYPEEPAPLETLQPDYVDNDSKTASVATAAGNAALTITEALIQELSEAVAIAVAESVANVIRQHDVNASPQIGDNTPDENISSDVASPQGTLQDGSIESSTLNNPNDEDGENPGRRKWGQNSNYNVNTNINQNSFRRNAARRGQRNFRRWAKF